MANSDEVLIRVDGIKWQITGSAADREPIPICPRHHLRLTPIPITDDDGIDFDPYAFSRVLKCEECDSPYEIPREYGIEQTYVLNKIDSRQFKQMKTINLDDEAVPLAVDRIDPSKESPYWLEVRLVESKTGRRLVIYAGEKGREGKTQIFVEPDIQRLSFDQTDRHPSEIFLKVEATFDSGHKSTMSKMA